MFGVYFHLCCRWSVEAWSKCRYLADDILKCIVFEQMLMFIVEYRWFLILRVWLTNIGTIVRGQFPSLRVIYQRWLNIGRMVTAFRSGSGTCIRSQGAYIWHIPHPLNRRSIYFSRLIAAMRPMATQLDTVLNILRPRQKDAILQTTYSNAISWMKMFEFWLKVHWSLFLKVQLTIFQHWFR